MKKINFLFISLVISICSIQAQLLWKISAKNLKHPSYLFGTHHLIPIQFLDSINGLFKVFNESETVVGEIVLNRIDTSTKIHQAAYMPTNKKVTDFLNQADFKLVDTELKAVLNIGLKEVSMLKPSMILSMYEMEKYKKLTGFSENNQSDSYFQLVSAEKDKKIIGLETIEEQIALLFDTGSLERQTEMLVESIRQNEKMATDLLTINKLYKAGKLNELLIFSKTKTSISDYTEDEFRKMVDDRNKKWVIKLAQLLHESSCFIAVGALHLPGQNGIIKLLENEGYILTPVR